MAIQVAAVADSVTQLGMRVVVVVPVAAAVAVLEALLYVGVLVVVDFVIQPGIRPAVAVDVDVAVFVPVCVLGPVDPAVSIGCFLVVAVAVPAARIDLAMVGPVMVDFVTPMGTPAVVVHVPVAAAAAAAVVFDLLVVVAVVVPDALVFAFAPQVLVVALGRVDLADL
jgi:hypothetical protein